MSTTPANPKQYSKFGQTFISYGSYHHNLMYIFSQCRNKIIHVICIPIITATFLALTTYIPLDLEIAGYHIGAFHIAVTFALIYYLSISFGAFVN